MKAVVYQPSLSTVWDEAVRTSRNGTFLFERAYMDYHHDRFEDASLLFTDDHEEVVAILPANIERTARRICSHGGLTYGGLLLAPRTSLTDVRDIFRLAARHYLDLGCTTLTLRPTPYIYHRYPCEEQLYWLTRAGAQLTARAVSSVIDLTATETRRTLWHRKTKKQACEGLKLQQLSAASRGGGVSPPIAHSAATTTIGGETPPPRLLRDFWAIVEDVLATRHATRPVHTVEEMALLCQRFPHNIRLFTVDNAEGKVITGALTFVTDTVLHVQYMEAGEEARRRRALDWLISRLITLAAEEGLHYLDFGISTEQAGRYLNEGLVYQKEGFGGRAVCYDTYEVELTNCITFSD